MKKLIKTIILTSFILSSLSMQGFATQNYSPPNVRLEGNSEGIVFIPENTPFLVKENMVPGETLERTMVLENKYDSPYEVFLRAERVTPKEEYDLLNKLELTIKYDNQIIYKGRASGENNLINDISLGTIKPGEVKNLIAEVHFDGSTIGNEYKNKKGQVNWIFTAINNKQGVKPDTKPQTGDDSLIPYVILGALSIVILLINRNKSNEESK
ncbi:MAG: LPXTG cell wall anchor domain-containing protein [Clostridium sp.]